MTQLRIAEGLTLPTEAVTEKLAFLGRTGSGKTYAAMKLAEEMYRAGAQFIVLDPVGKWWGLRLGADGKSPGLPVPVFGGLHGDIPLEPTAGKLVADLIADRNLSVVLDVSQFESDAAKARFASDFADRFFFRKKSQPSACHLFLEEAQEFVPQNPQRDEGIMLHRFTRYVKLGRNFGLGCSLISQRPQEVNKKVLNQTELLFAFQMTGPQERKTLEGWIAEKGIDEDIAGELPKLKQGEPHVWSPAWLQVSKVVHIREKATFDASSTPKVGARAVESQPLAPVDLERIRQDMAATIERAKAEDPKLLRQEVAHLKSELTKARKATQPAPGQTVVETKVERVEVPVLRPEELHRLEEAISGAMDAQAAAREASSALNQAVAGVAQLLDSARQIAARASLAPNRSTPRPVTARPAPVRTRPTTRETLVRGERSADGTLPRMYVAMLTALAQHPDGLSKGQILLHTAYRSSGPTSSAFADLLAQGYVTQQGNTLAITREGLQALGDYDPLPIGDELRDFLLSGNKLSRMEKAILSAITEAFPEPIAKGAALQKAGYASSGPTSSAFAKLVSYGYAVPSGSSLLRASEELFS